MNETVSKIWHSSSIRNVGQLLSASVIAQAIGLLVYPVLTRIYAPEDFALLSLFLSIANVIVLLATADYQSAIVLPKEETKAHALVHLCTFLLIVSTLIMSLSIFFARPISAIFKAPDLARYWWLMPLFVFVTGMWNILSYWYIRRKAFARISGYQMTQSIFAASGKVGLGFMGILQSGMLLASVFASLLSLIISIGLAWRKCIHELFCINWTQLKSVAKEYANFPKFNLPKALVNMVGVSLPIWILTPQFGLENIGRLSLAITASIVPLSLIARACNQVLYQRISESVQQQRTIRPLVNTFILWTGSIMIIGMAGVYIFLPQLVTLLFGQEWLETATIIRRLFPYLILTPICGSICFLSDVFSKQKIAMWMETGYLASLTLALLIGTHTCSFLTCVSLFAWIKFAYLAIQLVWFLSLIRGYHKCKTHL